jgi:hypothetical protein
MDCTWDKPGQDPYSGTPTAAIMQFVSIPKHVRVALAARAESRLDYDETVVIDRDSIRSKDRSYSSEITAMHFGSKGKLCDKVSRKNWKPDHIETAMVYCESGYCVMRPAVCNNWSILQREDDKQTGILSSPGSGGSFFVPAQEQPLSAIAAPAGYLPPAFAVAAPSSPSYAAAVAFYAVPVPVGFAFNYCPPLPVVPAVPEPSTWFALLGGIALLWVWKASRK